MALLFQNEYRACQKCGSRSFTVLPIVSIKRDSDESIVTGTLLECVSCREREIHGKDWGKQ